MNHELAALEERITALEAELEAIVERIQDIRNKDYADKIGLHVGDKLLLNDELYQWIQHSGLSPACRDGWDVGMMLTVRSVSATSQSVILSYGDRHLFVTVPIALRMKQSARFMVK